jgi:phosphoribosylamine--glycine ligase
MLALSVILAETKAMESIERVMVVDGGGRGQAIAQKLAAEGVEVIVSPGNPGNSGFAESTYVHPLDIAGQLAEAQRRKIDLTVVGSDNALANGIVDHFEAAGLAIFGPTRDQAKIEWDKEFAKQFAVRRHIPIAPYKRFNEPREAIEYAETREYPLFIKENGLAQGKGVVRCDNFRQVKAAVGDAPRAIIIESNISGPEVSHHAFADGNITLPIPFVVRDHKYLGENDTGPMTGGMGVVGPLPGYSPEVVEKLNERFAQPVVTASRFRGMLFSGLKGEPSQERILEWNARWGDPEAQVFLRLMKSDLLPILVACTERDLHSLAPLEWELGRAAVCLVIAAEGYPGQIKKASVIEGIEVAEKVPEVHVLQACTVALGSKVCVNGGRVLNIVAQGENFRQAVKRAYEAAEQINFVGQTPVIRRDIGADLAAAEA